MSTFIKRALELVVLAILIVVGLAIISGKIKFLEGNWFGIRTLQIILCSILSVLLLIYVNTDRKLSPRELTVLNLKSNLSVVFLASTFIWSILFQPTVPVTVSFDGIAKSSDVIESKRGIQKNNEDLAQLSEILLSFQKQLSNKLNDLDSDNQQRQSVFSTQISELSAGIKKMSVLVKNQDYNKSNHLDYFNNSESRTSNSLSLIIVALFVLSVISFITSFFFKNFNIIPIRVRRYLIPSVLIVICVALFFYPFLNKKIISMGIEKGEVKIEEKIKVEADSVKQEPVVEIKPITKEVKSEEAPIVIKDTVEVSNSNSKKPGKRNWH